MIGGDLHPALRRLAAAYGIAVEFWDWQGRHVDVPAETIVKVLAALDVDASTQEAAERAVAEHDNATWRRAGRWCCSRGSTTCTTR